LLHCEIVLVGLADIQTTYYLVAATGVLVAAIYYVYNMRATRRTQDLALKAQDLMLKSQEQTLETRQAQLFMQIYAKMYEPDFLANLNHVIAFEYKDFDDYERKVSWASNPDEAKKFGPVNLYFEGIGVLVKRGLISPALVDDIISGWVIAFWEKYRPWCIEFRRRYNYPAAGEHIEYLYNEIKRIADAEHGDIGPVAQRAFG